LVSRSNLGGDSTLADSQKCQLWHHDLESLPTLDLDTQLSPFTIYSTVTTSQENRGLGSILGSFHKKHIEISYARVYLYVLTIEPSHTLLLIHRNANHGITTP